MSYEKMSKADKSLLNYWLELDKHTHMRGRRKSLEWMAKMTCPQCKGAKSPQAKRCAKCANKDMYGKKRNKDIDIPKLRKMIEDYAKETGFPYK